MDKKDRKILWVLEQNSRQSCAKIAKQVGLSKEVVNYRIKRLEDKGYLNRFFAEINLHRLGLQVYKIYFRFQNIDQEKESEMYEYFTNVLKIQWIISCSGAYDMIVSFGAKDVNDLNVYLTQIMNKFSKFIRNRDISTTLYFITYNRRWLVDGTNIKAELRKSTVGGEIINTEIDLLDRKILVALSDNAREPILTIAKKTELSSAAIIQRMKKLEKANVINAYRIGLNYKQFGKEFCKAFVRLSARTEKQEKLLLSYVESFKETLTIIKSVGSWDLEFEFITDNFAKFHQLMKNIQNRFEIVSGYESVIISQEFGIRYLT